VDEVVARLRAMGQPVTLFGELELERYARMRKCEEEGVDDDFGISKGHGGELRNVFLDKGDDDDVVSDDDDDDDDEDDDGTPKKKGSKKKASGAAAGGPAGGPAAEAAAAAAAAAAAVPLTAEQKAAKKLKDEHGRVREYFKGLLRGWEAELNARPDHVKRTAQGKIDTKTQKQCKDYIRPLFKLCKRRDVPYDILASLIVMIQ
jgi:pre-mRNA-splicing factor 18